MAKAPPSPPNGGSINNVPLHEALEERYLAYALSTITGRALPDARDGLKPVHRRILYGMQVLRARSGHGPSANARRSSATSWARSTRMATRRSTTRSCASPRISPRAIRSSTARAISATSTGDTAAAYRYTEARMTEVARLLLDGIDEDTIDFRDNYAGTEREPIVLPSAFPNMLANGAQGIAVGMATSIPPHNLAELCDAALHMIAHKDADTDDLPALRAWTRFSDRRYHRRTRRGDRRRLSNRARRVPPPRALGEGRGRARRLAGRGHRNPLHGAEIQADRGRSPSCSTTRSCRSSQTSATNRRRTCASSSSRGTAPCRRR